MSSAAVRFFNGEKKVEFFSKGHILHVSIMGKEINGMELITQGINHSLYETARVDSF